MDGRKLPIRGLWQSTASGKFYAQLAFEDGTTGEKKTHADDVHKAVTAAWETGVHGITLSRDYSEMELDSLAAAGEATRAFLKRQRG